MSEKLPKLIVILGPTASGKTAMSIELAKRFNGEIVSADSRQVYRRLDIGSNKVSKAEQAEVPHHLTDVCDAGEQFTLADYAERTRAVIADIVSRGKTPFLVGGTALYIKAIVDNYQIPHVEPNPAYRAELEALSLEELVTRLERLDPEYATRVDRNNPRRLIRALEVIGATGKTYTETHQQGGRIYDVLKIAPEWPREELYARIDAHIGYRLAHGLIEEVEGLLIRGVNPDWLKSMGLDYAYCTRYIMGELVYENMVREYKFATHDFVRRQLTWWRPDSEIHWVHNIDEASSLCQDFLEK